MKKILTAAVAYGVAGILFGVFYQVLLKTWCCAEYAPLGAVHAHLLAMGMLLFLILLSLEKTLRLTCDKAFRCFFVLYNLGLTGAISIMVLQSLEFVWSFPCCADLVFTILGVLFHLLLCAGLAVLFAILKRRIFPCSCQSM